MAPSMRKSQEVEGEASVGRSRSIAVILAAIEKQEKKRAYLRDFRLKKARRVRAVDLKYRKCQ